MNGNTLQVAIENLAIKIVHLKSSELGVTEGFDPLIPGQQLIAQFNLGTGGFQAKEQSNNDEVMHSVKFHLSMGMRYLLKRENSEELEEGKEDIASFIKATFVAEYIIINNDRITNEALTQFGKKNVPYHVWPYWREYCQSMCSRLALPVFVMPMVQFNKPDNDSGED